MMTWANIRCKQLSAVSCQLSVSRSIIVSADVGLG